MELLPNHRYAGEQKKFVEAYKAKFGKDRVTDDPIEAGYFGVYLWAEAVKKAGSTDVEKKVKAAAKGIEYNAPGGKLQIDGDTQHVYKTVRIGEVQKDGQFKEIWNSGKPVKPDPWLKTYTWELQSPLPNNRTLDCSGSPFFSRGQAKRCPGNFFHRAIS